MELVSRAAAHASGVKQFFTGKVCKNGHIAPRYVSTGGCLACLRQYSNGFVGASVPGASIFPAQTVHADDHAQLYALVDYLNARRQLPPAVRPGVGTTLPSEFEAYVQKELKRPASARPSLASIESAAVARGFTVAYSTMARPVDTWSLTPEALQLRVQQARAQFAAGLDREGYLPDELPAT